jgi:hypothetical protein
MKTLVNSMVSPENVFKKLAGFGFQNGKNKENCYKYCLNFPNFF